MNRLLIFIGMILGGYAGWFAGDYMDMRLTGTFLVSSLGALSVCYVAWRIARDYCG